MLNGILQIPKIPMGNPQKSPSYCITDTPIQAAGQKDPKLELFGLFEIYCITLQQRSESVFLHLVLVVHIANNQKTIH